MDAIQRLRTKADANNKLTSTKEQRVTKRQEDRASKLSPLSQRIPKRFTCPTTIRPWSTARGLILSILHIIGDIPDISAPDSSGPDLRLAPDGLSETGARAEIIGAVDATGATAISTLIGRE